jgi:Xaa-Pro dipeptidase
MTTTRLERLTAGLRAAGLAGLALMPDANLTYLSGLRFHPGKRLTLALIPADGSTPCMVLPALEQSQVEAKSRLPMRLFAWGDADGPQAALAAALAAAFPQGLGEAPLAVEHTSMRLLELRTLEAAQPGLRTSDAGPLMASLRMAKDAEELAAIEQAVRIVEAALQVTIAQIRPGLSERALSRICSEAIMAAGAEGESFTNIVAAGPGAANPHHQSGERPLQVGDLIIIDCGARYDGYISDITRTVALGEPDEEARQVYELVRLANAAGRQACRPGASGASIDAATRAVIEAGGYGQYFIHRTGHGFGSETHEQPDIVAGNDEPLAVGTTFTIEPGIYLPGRVGVRIEDDMVLTADGARSLTTLPRELLIIPA